MSDKQIRDLLDEYAGRPSEGLRDRVRDRLAAARRAKRRAVSFRWAFVGACFLLIALGGLLMAPRVALANRLRQVHEAIAAARSVQFTVVRKANGRDRPVYSAWIEGSRSRRRRSYSPATAVDVLVKDGTKWTYVAGAPVATQEPYDPARDSGESDADVDALKFAKDITGGSGLWAQGNVAIRSHAAVGGREAFTIEADRNDGQAHASVVVDAESNLPISIAMDLRSQVPGTIRTVQTKAVSSFTFNEDLNERIFEPVFGPDVKIVETNPGKTHLPEVASESKPSEFMTTDANPCSTEGLFSLDYGAGKDQIGVGLVVGDSDSTEAIGGSGFAVRKDGDLIIADRANRKVKEFDRRGRLVLCTEGTLDDLASVAAGPDGTVLAVSGPKHEILSKFGRRGESLWSIRVSDAIPAALHVAGRLGPLSVADDGMVAARLDRTDWIVCFSKAGTFDSVRPATSVTADGRFVGFIPAIAGADATDAVLMDSTGRIVSKTRLVPMPRNSALVLAADVGEYAEPTRDEQGCWYRVWIQRKEKRIELRRDLQIRSEGIVTKYSAEGEPVAQGRVDIPPLGLPQNFAVDSGGFLYTLSYHTERVSLVRYRLPAGVGASVR